MNFLRRHRSLYTYYKIRKLRHNVSGSLQKCHHRKIRLAGNAYEIRLTKMCRIVNNLAMHCPILLKFGYGCTLCSKKSDAKIKITITTAHLIRINYPLSSFNYRLSGTNVANFNKIHHMVSEQQLFKKRNLKT